MKVAEVYNTYAKDLYRFCYATLKDQACAEDVVADSFEKLMHLNNIDPSTVKSWLYTVAHNAMKNRFRASKEFANPDDLDWIADDKQSTEAQLISEEEHSFVHQAFESLDAQQKEVLILKIWEGFKFKDIANILNSKENTVKAQYYRTLEKVRERYVDTVGRKDIRLNSIALGSLVVVIRSYSETSIFHPPAGLFNLDNLISTKTMDNLNPTQNTSLKSGLSKLQVIGVATGIVIAAVGALVALGLIGFGRVFQQDETSNLAAEQQIRTDENVPVITENENENIEDIAENSEQIDESEDYDTILSTNLNPGEQIARLEFTTFANDSGNLPEISFDDAYGSPTINGDGYELVISADYSTEGSMTYEGLEKVEIANNSLPGLFRVFVDNSSVDSPSFYTYTNDNKNSAQDGECMSYGPFEIEYPCGSGTILGRKLSDGGASYIVRAHCYSDNPVQHCDRIIQSMRITEL